MRVSDILRRARRAIGARFCPQGRSVETGLDCLGLVLLAYRVPGEAANYRLSGSEVGERLRSGLTRYFRPISASARRSGDLLLMRVAERQWHLGIWTGATMIHADAGARAVLERPGEPEWRVETTFRRRRKILEG